MADSVTVRQLVKATKLEVYSGSEYLDARQVVLSDISRPGLEQVDRVVRDALQVIDGVQQGVDGADGDFICS